VLFLSASLPLAVFWKPVVLLKSALLPLAILASPNALFKSALKRTAVLSWEPLLLSPRAATPTAVLKYRC
jgi:hypothetical protein